MQLKTDNINNDLPDSSLSNKMEEKGGKDAQMSSGYSSDNSVSVKISIGSIHNRRNILFDLALPLMMNKL